MRAETNLMTIPGKHNSNEMGKWLVTLAAADAELGQLLSAALGHQNPSSTRDALGGLVRPDGKSVKPGALLAWESGFAVLASRLGKTEPDEAALLLATALAT